MFKKTLVITVIIGIVTIAFFMRRAALPCFDFISKNSIKCVKVHFNMRFFNYEPHLINNLYTLPDSANEELLNCLRNRCFYGFAAAPHRSKPVRLKIEINGERQVDEFLYWENTQDEYFLFVALSRGYAVYKVPGSKKLFAKLQNKYAKSSI